MLTFFGGLLLGLIILLAFSTNKTTEENTTQKNILNRDKIKSFLDRKQILINEINNIQNKGIPNSIENHKLVWKEEAENRKNYMHDVLTCMLNVRINELEKINKILEDHKYDNVTVNIYVDAK